MGPKSTTLFLLFVAIHLRPAQSQNSNVPWTSDLSDLLTVTGLREDLPLGTKLGTLSVQVPADIIHPAYSTNSSYFSVNELTGEVTLKEKLSYRDMSSFVVAFFAKDPSQGFSSERDVTVNVRGINHAPAFDISNYQVSVKDNTPIGSTIYSLIYVTDIDTDLNGTVSLTCSPIPGNQDSTVACDTFGVTLANATGKPGSYLGSITILKQLNYMNRTQYSVPLKAQDGGTPPLSATATLVVNVESQFDNRPVFINTPITLVVNESAPSTTDLGSVQARSGNAGRQIPLKLNIFNDVNNWFFLENTTVDSAGSVYSAVIRTNGNINRAVLRSNQYFFGIKAVETVNGQETQVSSETTVQVFVNDINNYRPTFDSPTYTVNVTQGLGAGAVIPGLGMTVTDIDVGDNSFFEINVTSVSPAPSPDIFLVEPRSAQGSASCYLIVNKPDYLSYDDPNERRYTIQVTARETRTAERFSGTTVVTVNVVSQNNHPPVFTRSEYLASLMDNANPPTPINVQISAIDPDSGPSGRITYSFLRGNENSYFQIDPSNAGITLAKKLSYNTTGPYIVLTILARDGSNLNATATLRIQIIDSLHNGPVFTPPALFLTVPENSTDLPVMQFYASPLEKDKVVSYMLVGGNTDIFYLEIIPAANPNDQPKGVIKMRRGVDYNETPNRSGTFQLTVQATTSPPNPLSTNMTVTIYVTDINNNPPVFNPTIYYATINETTPPETTIVQLNASDADAPTSSNSKFHFIIDGGSRDNFVVDYTTGLVKVASRPDLSIDRFGDQYNITILAIDEGSPPLTGTAMVYITVKDSVYRPPTFDSQSYRYVIIETTPVNTVIGTVKATSPDRRAILVYSIRPNSFTAKNKDGQPVTTTSGNYNYDNSFTINSNGSISVNRPLSNNYTASIDFQVQASVSNPETASPIPMAIANVTVIILPIGVPVNAVNFAQPASKFVYISIYNVVPPGNELYQLVAYQVANGKTITNYTYTALMPGTQGYISVNNANGRIVLVQDLTKISQTLPINFTYVVTAWADPPINASDVATVVINVRDVNADTPVFIEPRYYNFTIYNNATQGTRVGQIQASLPGNAPGTIYYIIDGYRADVFYIDNITGILYVNQPNVVNGVTMNLFTLMGRATKGGSFPTQTIVVYVNVLHLYNTLPPAFSGTDYVFTATDKTPQGSTIGQVNAYDPDPFHQSTISYNITGGNGTAYFTMNPSTGSIQTNGTLVSNQFPYILNVTATSSGNPQQTTTIQVRIYVANTSPEQPMIIVDPDTDMKLYYAYVNRTDYTILTVKGVTQRNGTLRFGFTTPNYYGPAKFIINPNTGEFKTNGSLPWDPSLTSQLVCLNMTDDVLPPLTVQRCINVTFVSDQLPSFDLCGYLDPKFQASVLEHLPPGSYVTTPKACSRDKPPGDTDMIYKITAGNNDPNNCYGGKEPFTIDPATGNITTQVELLWNCTSEFVLNITVTNRNGTAAPNGATRQVVIHVEPTDASGPSFGADLPGTCHGRGTDVVDGVLDFTPPGTVFIQMFAGDCDAPIYANTTTYSIRNINYFPPSDSGTSAATPVPNAFAIDPNTGDVSTNLKDYRDYSRGHFTMQIVATDSKNRTATATLTVFIVREGQRIKFTFMKPPSEVRPVTLDYLQGVNTYLANASTQVSVSGAVLYTHVDKNAFYYFNETDICVQLIEGKERVLSANDAIGLFPPTNKSDFSTRVMNGLYTKYWIDQKTGPQPCYIKTTTHWWSGYWFLWWLLIALALFIFVLALILNILACCFWPIYTRGYLKSRPYIVLDEPPTTTPVSDFEWQESMHRIN